jgi:hypothetical protein
MLATTWVEMYHAVFIKTERIMKENEDIQMSAIKVNAMHVKHRPSTDADTH